MYRGQKRYSPTRGVDLKSSDILRPADFLSGGQNVRYDDQHNLIKRPGVKFRHSNTSQLNTGLYSFETTDLLGVTKKELIFLGTSAIARVVPTTITVTNGHASLPLYITIAMSNLSGYRVEATRNSILLGGYSIGSSTKVSDVVTFIAGLTSCGCTSQNTTYDSTTTAAMLDIQVNEVVPALGSRTFPWYYIENINTFTAETYGNPDIDGGRNFSDYAVNSAVTINNVLYIAFKNKTTAYNSYPRFTNISGIAKYDGQTFYCAGLPTPNSAYAGAEAAGTPTDVLGTRTLAAAPSAGDNWRYRYSFVQIDKAGNVIESGFSKISSGTGSSVTIGGGTVGAHLTFANGPDTQRYNRLNDGGYNNHFAMSSSAMGGASLTIPVDNGAGGSQTLAIGDIAFFYDKVQSKCIARKVEAASGSSITVSTTPIDIGDAGGSVQLNDNAVISNNLRVAIWRTKSNAGPSVSDAYYLVGEFPIRAATEDYSTNAIFYDQVEDSALGAILVEPEKEYGLPPFGSTLSRYSDTLIVSGATKDPNTLWFSERDNVENFPAASNSINLPYKVTGHGESGGVLSIFGDDNISTVIGDLSTINFRVESISSTVGCVSHGSIKKVNESEVFFLSKKGPHRLIGGRDLLPVGVWSGSGFPSSRIEPYFTAYYPSFDSAGKYLYKPKFSMAVSEVIPEQRLYIISIPWTTDYKPHYNSPHPLDPSSTEDTGYPTGQAPTSLNRCMTDTWVYDLAKDCWLPVWRGMDFSAGIAYHNGVLWGATRNSSAVADTATSLFTLNRDKGAYNYIDMGKTYTGAVTGTVITSWESLGEPDLWKNFLWLTVSTVGTRESSSFDIDLTTSPNFDNATTHTSATLLFSDKMWKRVKLKSAKMNSIQISMSNNTMNETFSISGWELVWNSQHEYPSSASSGTMG